MQAPFADPLSGLELQRKILTLVGREAEMQLVHALLDTVALNRAVGARAVTVSGDVGMGKSRLLAEMGIEARARGFQVLEGHTYEAGGMFPYLPFIEALRPVLRTSSLNDMRWYVGLEDRKAEAAYNGGAASLSLTGAPLVMALARLFPELPGVLDVTSTAEVLSADQEKFRLFDAIATLLERMAMQQPIMLAIDNLQWADSASLELTLYLTVRLHSSQVALAGATRPPGASGSSDERVISATAALTATRMLGELMRQGLLLLLPLGPLSPDAAARHLHALLPGTFTEALGQSLLDRAGGNPFFLEELVRALTLSGQLVLREGVWRTTRAIGSELPESIMLAVGQRLQGLSAACLEMLRVAALFGRIFPVQALVSVLEQSEEQVQAWIDEAAQAAIIALSPDDTTFTEAYAGDVDNEPGLRDIVSALGPVSYMFCQGIVQEALYNELPVYRRRGLHAHIGTALEAYYAEQTDKHAAELARHYISGGEQGAALYWSLLAGEDAARQQAHREAISHFRVVLKLREARIDIPRERYNHALPLAGQLHIAIGESWFKLGELEQAVQAFQQAIGLLQGIPDVPTLFLAQANRLLADIYRMQGKYELALAHLQAARKALDADAFAGIDEAPRIPWMSMHGFATERRQAKERTQSRLLLQKESTTERILLLQAQATLDLLFNRPQESEAAFWESYQLATELGDRGSQAFALHFIGWIRGWGEHINEAIRLQEQAHELYVAIGDPFRAALGDQGLGIIYQALGEMEKARLHNLRGFEQARRYGVRPVLGWLHWNQGVMAFSQGDWAESENRLQQAMQEAEATNNARLKPIIMQVQAELQFRRGDWQEAEQFFTAAIQASLNNEWYPSSLALYGHFLAVTGRRTAARAQLERAVALPEPAGYSGHFYIPFLAEGFLHLGAREQAAKYIERIRALHGFMYYGVAVDRILGEVASAEHDWETAEGAFEDGLALCRRTKNEPEEASILYEQARMALMRSREASERTQQSLEEMHRLCNEARKIFLRYEMRRAADLVDTLQDGVRQLERRERGKEKGESSGQFVQEHIAHTDYQLDLHMTVRELEVLRLVAEGHTDREVAEALVISPRTVNRHLSNIFMKLDVPGRAAAVAFAIRQGLVG